MQFIAELTHVASEKSSVAIDAVRLSVTESQLINILKDLNGTVVCGSIPGSETNFGNGYRATTAEPLLMVLQKMPRDEQGTSAETERYERLQRFMQAVVDILSDYDYAFDRFCDRADLDSGRPMVVEWEYNVYGGFNGLSLTFRLREKP